MPRTVTIDEATAIIRSKLGSRGARTEIRGSSRLDDLGLSSLEVADTFFELEELVGHELDATVVADVQTLDEMLAAVNGQADRLQAG
ncbi:MAG TPA: phosphopantetheine-binding protein [Thermoleophilaceae bacterium]|jgi:acyl carrier protein